jgi:23S rRNA (cytosine1962-C5)-methyltransferase
LNFVERVANPTVFADVSPERSLKVLAYQMPALAASNAWLASTEGQP